MNTQRHVAYWLTLPVAVALLALLVYPLLYAGWLSFASISPRAATTFAGLANYARVMGSEVFRIALVNTTLFTIASTALSFLLGLSLALAMLNLRFAVRTLVTLAILPLAVMPVVSGLSWGMMLNPSLGVVNGLLRSWGIAGPGWATSPDLALLTIVLIDVWQWTPFVFLILYAGLQALPTEPLEAARIDGAGGWQRLVHVTLPMLRPIIAITLIFRGMEAFRAFDVIYTVTKGGPGRASETLILRAFLETFSFHNPSAAAVYGIVMLVITILLARPAARLLSRRD
jgi:multiple sugar transport system permease protein